MAVLKNLYYTKDHEWLKVKGNKAYVGITDFAQEQLGDIVYVELPEVDDEFNQDDDFSAIESVKAASDIYMPVDGVILEVNEELLDSPELINTDAFENWIVKIQITNPEQLEELMTSEEYEEFIAEEE
ncbi:MAG: glycine cleavage system protein GcvH [Tissierellaceae bacterium]|nr:glycine cleavage system protein GcvH [Tissierellaceae bacterium]